MALLNVKKDVLAAWRRLPEKARDEDYGITEFPPAPTVAVAAWFP